MRVKKTASKKKGELSFAFEVLAEWTGLEPATPGVTGRYSNRLNYHSIELLLLIQNHFKTCTHLVGANGIEPLTFAL